MELYCTQALFWDLELFSVGGSSFRKVRTKVKHLSFWILKTNLKKLETLLETRSGWQFYWGGILLNGNAGVLRCSKLGWKSSDLCNDIRALDCESDGSSRCESRS